MSHLKAGNVKLRDRAVRIVMAETGMDQDEALAALEATNWIVQEALRRK
jgi:N-acetylmuramic acid 6-phosphate (MurNAc-6-P) etherase